MFVDDAGKILYIGKATNLRSRVRSYFGAGETRKKVGALLKLVKGVHFIETPDPVTAEVLEIRLIGKLRPRYNFVGTRSEKYCYVRLTTDEEWPRLVVTKVPSAKGISVGPISTRTMAREMIEAIESVVPLRRCTVRMGRNYVASPDAPVCSAAQLGLAQCPCSGSADPVSYAEIVQTVADVLTQKSTQVLDLLDEKMKAHSAARQFEDAALIRDRIQTVNTILRRHRQATALRQEASLTIQAGDVTYELECGVLRRLMRARRLCRVRLLNNLRIPCGCPDSLKTLSRSLPCQVVT
jgi:DNA polymerase-3 subunit epsilon